MKRTHIAEWRSDVRVPLVALPRLKRTADHISTDNNQVIRIERADFLWCEQYCRVVRRIEYPDVVTRTLQQSHKSSIAIGWVRIEEPNRRVVGISHPDDICRGTG